MFNREIPEEFRQDIINVVQRNSGRIIFARLDLIYCMTMYYRFVGKVYADETVEECVERDMKCPNCKGKIQAYFKNAVNTWQNGE
jgi:hypothetical protein